MHSLPERYKPIGSRLSGGFGEVVICQDQHLERKVAIKFIQDPEEIRRLTDELRALLMMRSKHVVQVFDIIPTSNGIVGIVEEFVDGDDLWANETVRSSAQTYLKTIWQIACGIADIHAADVIHRDIKPNNMKIDGEGLVKIFDFGLAREIGPSAVTNGFVGTLGFAAPEMFKSGAVNFSKAIDTYAFAASALLISTGNLPQKMLCAPPIEMGDADIPQVLHLPKDLKCLILRCLSIKPEDRPSMATVRDELARHLLRDRHQALAVNQGRPLILNSTRRLVRLSLPQIGLVEISYDGLRFYTSEVTGEVFMNNQEVKKGMILPGSCVIGFGGGHRRANQRAFVPFDVSNPEVVV